jgi:DNA-binding MarR family transcriptional regulator
MLEKSAHTAKQEILEALVRAGRENSDATVLFHAIVAEQLGLNSTDYKVMSILERLGALSAGEIARYSGLATASVTDLIDRLEKKGFVRRVPDPNDRRRIRVEPVVDRVTAARKFFASAERSLARLYERYPDQDLAVIADFLSRNAERLRAETEKLQGVNMAQPHKP